MVFFWMVHKKKSPALSIGPFKKIEREVIYSPM